MNPASKRVLAFVQTSADAFDLSAHHLMVMNVGHHERSKDQDDYSNSLMRINLDSYPSTYQKNRRSGSNAIDQVVLGAHSVATLRRVTAEMCVPNSVHLNSRWKDYFDEKLHIELNENEVRE